MSDRSELVGVLIENATPSSRRRLAEKIEAVTGRLYDEGIVKVKGSSKLNRVSVLFPKDLKGILMPVIESGLRKARIKWKGVDVPSMIEIHYAAWLKGKSFLDFKPESETQ